MRRHTPPVCRRFADDEQAPDDLRPPCEPIKHDLRRQARLDVKASDRVVDRGQLGFDLDDEDQPDVPLQAENVDRPTVAVLVERDLELDLPAQSLERPGHPAHKTCVALIQESVDRATAPGDGPVKACPDSGEDAPDRLDREPPEVASLDERDDRLRYPGGNGHVQLA